MVLNTIINAHQSKPNGLTVYLTYHKCINETDLTDKDTFKASGGISPTGTGVAFVTLNAEGHIEHKSTVHELMHALGLKHTFESMYKLKYGKTSNYMDYNNNKKHTYKWQWQNLRNYLKLK